MKYTYRFNPFTRYYEVLEIIAELEHCIRVYQCETEKQAVRYIAWRELDCNSFIDRLAA